MNPETKSAESKINYDTMSAEELIYVLVNVAKQLEKWILADIKHTRLQVEKLAQTTGITIPQTEEVKPASKWEKVKESLKEPVLYRHPDNQSLEWNGTGRRPKWIRDLEKKEGWNIEDLKVRPEEKQLQAEELKVEVKPEEGKEETNEPSVVRFPWFVFMPQDSPVDARNWEKVENIERKYQLGYFHRATGQIEAHGYRYHVLHSVPSDVQTGYGS